MGRKPGQWEVSHLTVKQRNMLVGHIDGPVEVSVHGAHLVQTRNSLLTNGMLQPHGTDSRPKHTVLTDTGRHALAMILADCAEVLAAAGMIKEEEKRPIKILARIKERRAAVPTSPEAALLPARLAMERFQK